MKIVPEFTSLPEVPGIIEGAVAIVPQPDGTMSFRVLIGAGGGRADCRDRIELIISPEHIRQALARTAADRPAGAQPSEELPSFPCHIGFSRNSVTSGR